MHTCQTIGVGHKASDVEGLISQAILDEFWEMATSEMLSVLRQHCVSEGRRKEGEREREREREGEGEREREGRGERGREGRGVIMSLL